MRRYFPSAFFTSILLFCAAKVCANGLLTETWESASMGPFDGVADVAWVGDTNDFVVTTATWPSGPGFTGTKSLRSGNGVGGVPSTILTDISQIYAPTSDVTWSVFVSGNSATITTGKRIDLVLLSSSGDASAVETPAGITGYKVCLWDALNSGGAGHSAAQLSYSMSLWKVGPEDTYWQLLGAHEFSSSVDIRAGWRIEVTRTRASRWQVAWTNGAATNTVGGPVIDIADENVPGPGEWFSGPGLLATSTDLGDFGFDEFRVDRRPGRPALTGFSRTVDSIELSVQGLTPGRQVVIEECHDLQCVTGWHNVNSFIPGHATTNIMLSIVPETRSAYYRARVE